MGGRIAIVLVVVAGSFHLTSGVGLACSCASGDNRDRLHGSDAAFIGVLISREEPTPNRDGIYDSGQKVTYHFKVNEEVKGQLGPTVDVESSADGASCGIEARRGEEVGLLLYRRGAEWTSSLCSTMTPDELRKAAQPMPAPASDDPVRVVVGGNYGDVRAIGLDAAGRTVAYGRGSGSVTDLDVCPASRLVAELVNGAVDDEWWNRAIAVRDVRTMNVVREIRIEAFGTKPENAIAPWGLSCLNDGGTSFAAYALSDAGDAKLVRFDARGETVLFDGKANHPVAFSPDRRFAYVAQGPDADVLTKIDLESGAGEQLGPLPAGTSQLVIDEAGTSIAGTVGSKLFLFDLGSRESRTGAGGGTIVWIDDDHFALSATSRSDTVRIYDRSLSVVDSWDGSNVAWTVHGDGVLYAVRPHAGDVMSARARTGPERKVNAFDTPELYAIGYVPEVGAEPQPTPEPTPTPSPTPEPTMDPTPSPTPLSPPPFAGSSSEPTNSARVPLAATGGALGIAAAGLAAVYRRRGH